MPDKLVELIKVDIGEKLRGQVAYWQALSFKEGRIARYKTFDDFFQEP